MIEPSDKARILSTAMAELMNCLAMLAWPDRFGELPASYRSSLVETVRALRDGLGDGTNVQTDAGHMLRLLPEIERALVADENIEQLARQFFSSLGVDLDKLTTT